MRRQPVGSGCRFFSIFLQPDVSLRRLKGMNGIDENALIQRTLAGDARAFEYLVRQHQDGVAAFIWRIVPSALDREEVVQDVFLKAYRNLGRFRGTSSLSTWLYSIAWRTAISKTRRKRIDAREYQDDIDSPEGSHAVSNDAQSDEVSRLLRASIARLPPEDRAIITLYHVQGCTIDEISMIIERPAGTIKSSLFRARKRLKDDLMPLVSGLEHPEDIFI